MKPDGYPERLLKALVMEYLELPRLNKVAKSKGIVDKDVAVRADIVSRSQVDSQEWTKLYRDKVRPPLLELYRDGLIKFDRLGRTGIWLSTLRPTKAGIQYIRLMMHS